MLNATGQTARAKQTLERAIRIAPADPETWYAYGVLDSDAGKIEKAIALDPSLPAQSRTLGEILLKNGDIPGAEAALKEALRVDPWDEDAWDLSGRLHFQKAEIAEAMFDFERAIQLQPGSALHLYDYALALARANRFDEARTRIETALRADDTLAEAHELLGGLFERKGQLSDCVREYRRALELRPDLERVRARLDNVLRQSGAGR
jgi:tetratricopeptide (TPR) repeat protein